MLVLECPRVGECSSALMLVLVLECSGALVLVLVSCAMYFVAAYSSGTAS